MTTTLMYRIYQKIPKQAHRLLGIVHAITEENALERAKNGAWHLFLGDKERDNDHENWVSMV